jgi:hypothetical protein
VKEQPDTVETAATTSSIAFGYDRIEEVPTRSRNYLNFVKLAPGVASSSGQTNQKTVTGIRSPLADSGFSFSGMRGRNNAINIDGVDNRDEVTGGSRVAIGLEMVQEFRVAGIAVGSELGGASGGMINVVTKSGANAWHGDGDFFLQNEYFNARKPEAETTLKPRFRRYQPGTSTNGPIRKDHTFVAAAVEYESESGQEWSEVPASSAAAINRALLDPRYAAVSVRSVLRGFFDTAGKGVEFSTKVDHRLATNNTLSLRYGVSRGRETGDMQGTENYQDYSAGGSSLTTDHSLVGNWTSVLSSNVVNQFRAQLANCAQEFRPNAIGPMFEIPGTVTFGQGYRLNGSRTEQHYEAVENLSFVVGAHQISVGADLHSVRLDAAFANRFGGIYIFPTVADFVRGTPDVFIQAFGQTKTNLTTVPVGLWFQDRWQVRPGVLIEAGARFDRQRMPAGLPSSTNNVSPRLGAAWTPGKNRPLVLRAGFGLFYDRYPLAWLNDALQKNGVRGFEQYAVGDAAVQALAISQGGTLAAPLPGVARSLYQAAAHLPSTYSRKFSVGVEQGIDRNTSVSVEADEVRGFHLPRTLNSNGMLPPLYQLEQTGRSEFRGAAVTLHRRMKGAGQPINVKMGDLTDESLVVSDKKEETAIPRDVIERIDARPTGKSRVTTESKIATKDVTGDPKAVIPAPNSRGAGTGPTTETSTGFSVGSKGDFETVYRRPTAALQRNSRPSRNDEREQAVHLSGDHRCLEGRTPIGAATVTERKRRDKPACSRG